MRTFLISSLSVLLLTLIPNIARADYFIWQDAETGLSFSFPDTWRVINNGQPDDLLTVMAPAGRAQAVCRVRANDDGRFTIFPNGYGSAVQRFAINKDFWTEYLYEYDDARITEYRDYAELGMANASYVVAEYSGDDPGPYMKRKALMLAGLYNGMLYVMECSAHRDAFDKMKPSFLSVAKTVGMKKVDHEYFNGYYRNFMRDDQVEIENEPGRKYVYN